jgi:uncharacterized membrane protein YfcA
VIDDPWFYAAAVPAVLLFGISKGGFGGGMGIVAVPLMALVVSPLQAAAILLPILCAMDLVAVWKFRGRWVWPELRVMLPASLAGILVGSLLFQFMSTAVVRLIVGVVAITFTLHFWVSQRGAPVGGLPDFPRAVGLLGGGLAGFTSFVAHAGGPPFSMYLLRRPLDRFEFAATSVLFFAVVNYVKLAPYAWLGQFDATNLLTSAALIALAPAGVLIGVRLHSRISDRSFFAVIYVGLFAVGSKLVYDGVTGLA